MKYKELKNFIYYMSYYKVILINEVRYQYKDKYTDPCNRIVKKQDHTESIYLFF